MMGEIREIKDGIIEKTRYEQQRNQVGKKVNRDSGIYWTKLYIK